MNLPIRPKYIPLLATALVLAGLYAAGCARWPRFSSLSVAVNLLGDNGFLGVAAIGVTFVILSGGIDLSVGAMVAFTSTLIATLIAGQFDTALPGFLAHWVAGGVHPLTAIAIALAIGAAFGAGMGCIIHFYRQPPFLVTLAGMFLMRGLGFVVHKQALGIKHPFYMDTIAERLAIPLTQRVSIPFTAICFLAVLAVALVIAHFTRFGRAVHAVGDDEQSATLMGVPVGRTKVLVYTLSGFCSALAGVVFTFYMQSGNPASGVGFELDAIAAAVIGGTLLSGGVGFVGGTALGVLILGMIQTIINFQGNLNTWWTRIVVGVLVLAFIGLQDLVALISRPSRLRRGRGFEVVRRVLRQTIRS